MEYGVEYLYVLDYSDNTISEIKIAPDEDAEVVLTNYGFNPDNCSWMFSNNKLELQTYGE